MLKNKNSTAPPSAPTARPESIIRFFEDLRAAHDRKRKNRSAFVMAWYDQAIALVREMAK